MDNITQRKIVAGGKVLLGAGRMVSGVATAFGVGILGSFLRHRHMQRAATHLGKMSLEAGSKMLKSGWSELHR
jgi:hypothetical protein